MDGPFLCSSRALVRGSRAIEEATSEGDDGRGGALFVPARTEGLSTEREYRKWGWNDGRRRVYQGREK